jgi:hypothetical protein
MYEYGQTVCNPCLQKSYAEGDRYRREQRELNKTLDEKDKKRTCNKCDAYLAGSMFKPHMRICKPCAEEGYEEGARYKGQTVFNPVEGLLTRGSTIPRRLRRGQCPKCGKKKRTGNSHCHNCGYQLRLLTALEEKQRATTRQQRHESRRCKACGYVNRVETSICLQCRKEIQILAESPEKGPSAADSGILGKPVEHEQKTWLQKVDEYTDPGIGDGLIRHLTMVVRGLFESVAGFMIVPLFMMGIGLVGISFWGAIWLLSKVLEALGG